MRDTILFSLSWRRDTIQWSWFCERVFVSPWFLRIILRNFWLWKFVVWNSWNYLRFWKSNGNLNIYLWWCHRDGSSSFLWVWNRRLSFPLRSPLLRHVGCYFLDFPKGSDDPTRWDFFPWGWGFWRSIYCVGAWHLSFRNLSFLLYFL